MDLTRTDSLKKRCKELGLNYVGFRGDPKNPLWFVGESPGADEDRIGVSFVGASGREQDRMNALAGLEPCFTNPYKVRPPVNDLNRIEELGIPRQTYIDQFFEELNAYKPSFIVTLGATSTELLCPFTVDRRDKETKISQWRGSLLTSPRLPWDHYVVPNLHPAYVLREWSDRDVAVLVLRKIKDELDYWRLNNRLQPLPERQLITNPSPTETEDFLNECLRTEGLVSVDIELLARRVPFCIGVSHDPRAAVSLDFLPISGSWSTTILARIWRLLDRILATKRILGQNYISFDANWLSLLGFDPGVRHCHDLLLRHHILYPEMSHKLEFQCMQYTREPFYKDEGRGWRVSDGVDKLKRYNCKDASVTLEIFYEQEKEFADICHLNLGKNGLIESPTVAGYGNARSTVKDTHTQQTGESSNLYDFYLNYELPLARRFFYSDRRGLRVDTTKLAELRKFVLSELASACTELGRELGRPVAPSSIAARQLEDSLHVPALNVASPLQIKNLLTDLGIKLKKDRKTHKESTGEETLNEAFAATGNKSLKHILRIRELNKILGTNINTRLLNGTFYFSSNPAGTLGGRRSSRKNFLGYGSNAQNQPKHTDLGHRLREVYVARPGKILISCDQYQAEDWIVQGIIADVCGDMHGIEELRSGVDRHQRLASQIFGIPLERCRKGYFDPELGLEPRYLGKKTRHAGDYGMQADKMAAEIAKEGGRVPKEVCDMVLRRFHSLEPNIKNVFQRWVEDQVLRSRRLVSPLGRVRDFYGINPYRDNSKIFREAYSYIPQTTVGDNTGMAILVIEDLMPGVFIKEDHDAVLLEVKDHIGDIQYALWTLNKAFDRVIRFPNGFELKIPIEVEIGYSLSGMRKCPVESRTGLQAMLDEFRQSREAQCSTTGGQL